MHTMAEAYVDGKWQVGDVSIDDYYQAALGLPLSRFGDDSSATWSWEEPGKTLRYEAIPPLFTTFTNVGMRLMKGIVLMLQDSWSEALEMGRKIIDEAGGEEEYDRKIRRTYKAKLPEVSKKLFNMLYAEEPEPVKGDMKPALKSRGSVPVASMQKESGVAISGT